MNGEWFDENVELIISIGVLIVFVVGILVAMQQDRLENANWKKYSADHHCESRGTKKGQIEPVLGGKGGVTMGDDQTVYVCDGGEIVIR